MDEQTKQALQELKATTDAFSANAARWIEQMDADVEEIAELAAEVRNKAYDLGCSINRIINRELVDA